jgi:hypothetical protein
MLQVESDMQVPRLELSMRPARTAARNVLNIRRRATTPRIFQDTLVKDVAAIPITSLNSSVLVFAPG